MNEEDKIKEFLYKFQPPEDLPLEEPLIDPISLVATGASAIPKAAASQLMGAVAKESPKVKELRDKMNYLYNREIASQPGTYYDKMRRAQEQHNRQLDFQDRLAAQKSALQRIRQ